MPVKTNDEKEPVTVRIPKEILRKIERYAREKYMDRTEYIRRVLVDHVEEKEKEEQKFIEERVKYYLQINSEFRKKMKKYIEELGG